MANVRLSESARIGMHVPTRGGRLTAVDILPLLGTWEYGMKAGRLSSVASRPPLLASAIFTRRTSRSWHRRHSEYGAEHGPANPRALHSRPPLLASVILHTHHSALLADTASMASAIFTRTTSRSWHRRHSEHGAEHGHTNPRALDSRPPLLVSVLFARPTPRSWRTQRARRMSKNPKDPITYGHVHGLAALLRQRL